MAESTISGTDDVAESEEDIRCVMSVTSSSSSSCEDSDHEESNPMFKKDPSNYIQGRHPRLHERLHEMCNLSSATIFLSKSFLGEWTSLKHETQVPNGVVCDVAIFSPSRPVFLLTFCTNGRERNTKYNTKTARHLVLGVRKSLLPDFSVVKGVVYDETWQLTELFSCHLNKLESEARIISVDQWLTMDSEKHKCLLNFFKAMSIHEVGVKAYLEPLTLPKQMPVILENNDTDSEFSLAIPVGNVSQGIKQPGPVTRTRTLTIPLLGIAKAELQKYNDTDAQKLLVPKDNGMHRTSSVPLNMYMNEVLTPNP